MSLRTFIEHNYWLKLFSLLLATLIWFIIRPLAIQTGKRPEAIQLQQPGTFLPATGIVEGSFSRLPVMVLSSAADPRSFRIEPPEVSIEVSGPKDLMKDLTARDIQVLVDLTDLLVTRPPGQLTNAFARKLTVNTPPGVNLVRVEPSAVRIERVAPAGPSLTPAPAPTSPVPAQTPAQTPAPLPPPNLP
jgi:hypothetical protein